MKDKDAINIIKAAIIAVVGLFVGWWVLVGYVLHHFITKYW